MGVTRTNKVTGNYLKKKQLGKKVRKQKTQQGSTGANRKV